MSRLTTSFSKEDIVIATSSEESDDVIERLALEEGVKVFRGDLSNVALRFINASGFNNLDYAIRITGDSLFMDPKIAIDLVEYLRLSDFDLISNRQTKMYPIGETVEIVNINTMKKLYPLFSAPGDFEHVTQFLYNNESKYNIKIMHHVNPSGTFRGVSLAIDTPEDLNIASQVMQLIKAKYRDASYLDIYSLYRELTSDNDHSEIIKS